MWGSVRTGPCKLEGLGSRGSNLQRAQLTGPGTSNFHPGGRARAFAGCKVNSEVPSSRNHLRTAALARGRGPCCPTPAKDFAGRLEQKDVKGLGLGFGV